jgi:S-adenosylmethionine:tRNA ribosyltransferase-isomerase
LIADQPAEPRDSARLLVIPAEGGFADRRVCDLPELLRPGDIVVCNDTKVIPARLLGTRGAATVEITLAHDRGGGNWQAYAKGARRLHPGDRIDFADDFVAEVVSKEPDGSIVLRFALEGSAFAEALARYGGMPLPPYIKRPKGGDPSDRAQYQTMFARAPGAVAAPTAGLHFTQDLMARLAARGIGLNTVTLHVGAGTFLPVKADDVAHHKMHAEWGQVTAEVAAALQHRIVAVGSTSLRLIESAAREDGTIAPFAGDTSLLITPGYRFRAVDVLLTNFHLPRSTLFMLVAAFCGLDTMKRAYAHAMATGYRFYSYGDACLLFRNTPAT